MYICIVARGLPSERYKMNGIFEYDQARALSNWGIKIVYIALDLRSFRRWRRWGIQRKVQEGMIIYQVNIPVGAVPDKVLCYFGKKILSYVFKRIVQKEGKPDIIHAHFVQQAYMATVIKQRYRVPLIITEHSDDVNKQVIKKDIFYIAKQAYTIADAVLVVSEALKRRIQEQFKIDAKIISNIIDFSCFRYIERKQKDYFQFVSVGGLIPGKQMDLLIDSFHMAFQDDKKVYLKIFGEGTERVILEKKIELYNLSERVLLLGLQDRQNIFREMEKSDCFILLSKAETFGMAYVEAMATGLPVIATRCGGPEEFVNEQNGILVPINNSEAVVKAMIKMRDSAIKYDSRKISEYVIQKYSNNSIVTQLVEVYTKVGNNVFKNTKIEDV